MWRVENLNKRERAINILNSVRSPVDFEDTATDKTFFEVSFSKG